MKPIYEIWGLELYDKIWSSTKFSSEQVRLISGALRECSVILDLGTGIGTTAKHLIKEGKTVYSLDISQKSLDYAERRINSTRFHPLQLDAHELAFVNKFDGAYCASNMSYFENLDLIVSRVHTSLKPKGLFAITGYEKEQMKKWKELSGQESADAITNGQIKLGKNEEELLKYAYQSEVETRDSSQRTHEALTNHGGFTIMRNEKFYQGTSYFVLARKK